MYQAFYKLTGKPFRLSPDPAFFFPSRGHKRALAYLRYGLNQDEGFVVITGSPGTGKTTLAKILLQEMDAGVVVAHLTTTQLEADDMLRMVAASFGLRYEGLDKAGLLKSLENFLLARSRERKRALLVIDEAQNLPARSLEELRMLSNLQIGDKALLQIFLLGQEQFRNMLDDPALEQLRQRVIANYHLTPLAADECQRYIESRLLHVGWSNDPHFAEVAHELIHRYTDGIPRRINMICDRILLYGCMEETHEITGEVVNLVKSEMEEEISGKAVDQGNGELGGSSESAASVSGPKASDQGISRPSQGNFRKQPSSEIRGVTKSKLGTAQAGNSGLVQKSKPAASDSQTKETSATDSPAKESPAIAPVVESPAKYELLKAKTAESENLGIMSTSFDNAEVEGGFEELDIDYALFEDKELDSTGSDHKSYAQKTERKETNIEEKSATYSSPKVEERSVKEERSAKEARPARKAPQPEPKIPQIKEPELDSSSNKSVRGNTVQKTKPETVKSDDGESVKPSEISERDLFRVIPGGKSFSKIPGISEPGQAGIAASAQSEPSSSDVKLRRILRLVLAFHRSPSRFPGLDSPMQPLPEGVTELLELAISDDQVLNQVSPAAVMGISPVMLRAAVRFFVRRALFAPDGDHYRCLGLQPGASQSQIEKHYDLLMRLLRQDKQRGSADSVERVGQAYEALSRGEQGPSSAGKVSAPSEGTAVFEEEVKLENETDSDATTLTIDFDEVEKNPPRPEPSLFVAKPNERFSSVANSGMSRKTVRYASQVAVLGFGALVIILGLYIVQLEPSNPPTQPKSTAAQDNNIGKQVAAITDKPGDQMAAEYAKPSQILDSNALNDEAKSTDSMQSEADARSEIDKVEAMRRELLAKRRAAPTTDDAEPNYESALDSTLDTNSAQSSEVENILSTPDTAKAQTSNAQPAVAAAPQQSVPQQPVSQQKPAASVPQTASADTSAPAQPQAAPSNQFEGRDIEIVENKPRRTESFSSIAARTPTPKYEAAKASPPAATPPPSGNSAPVKAATPPTAVVESPKEPATVASATPSTALQTAKQQTAANITTDELLNLVDEFVDSYRAGNVDKVMSLFASDARTNNRTNAREIQSDYVELFKSTTARKMTISGLNWNIESDYARGVGDYRAQINPVSSQNSQTFTGNITIQVEKIPAGLKISRFYFSNQNVSTSPRMAENKPAQTAPATIATAKPAKAAPAKAPSTPITAQDLQNLINKFAQNYANGNIDGLMALFGANAKTNDQNTLAGIRKDYQDLFQGSASRQMIIRNMKWTLANNQARGEGPFEVKVKAKGSKAVTSVKGSLKITVEKNNQGAKITEMIHNIQ